jgi:hypothetical protein
MSVKIALTAIAALVAATAAPELASARATSNAQARVVQHHTLRTIPWDAYGSVGTVQTPWELTGGNGYGFQLGGRF